VREGADVKERAGESEGAGLSQRAVGRDSTDVYERAVTRESTGDTSEPWKWRAPRNVSEP
jgi:hypothetical protein